MSAQTKFTKGKWSVGVPGDGTPGYVYCDNELGSAVAICYGKPLSYPVFTREEEEANAHLIAASPDIYAALDRVLDVYGLGDKDHLEIYEEAAEEFRRKTGRMALGKDSSPHAYVSEEYNAETSAMWTEFCTKRRDDAFVAARAALKRARGEA